MVTMMLRTKIFACLMVFGLAAPAMAQDEPQSELMMDPDKEASPAKDEGITRTQTGDQSIYIVQERSYAKTGKIEVTPIFYTAINPKFVAYVGGGLSAAYHLRENLAVEVMGGYNFYNPYSNLTVELLGNESLTPDWVDLKKMSSFGALSLQWSALYGKFEFYGNVVDYDFYVTAGFGMSNTVEYCIPSQDADCNVDTTSPPDLGMGTRTPAESADATKLSANLGGGMRMYFHERLGLRLEIRDISYADRATNNGAITSDIRNTMMLVLGASFMF